MSYERFGTTVTTELLPDGNSIPVTSENRERRLLPQYKCMHRSACCNHKFVPQCCRVCLSVCEPLAEWVHWEAVYCLLLRLSQRIWLQCSDSESKEWFPLIINLQVKLILIILYMCLLSFTLQLFRPEEIEMLVCGCPEFNMHALESVTVYDEYDQTDTTIRYSNKPQLLQSYSLSHDLASQTHLGPGATQLHQMFSCGVVI